MPFPLSWRGTLVIAGQSAVALGVESALDRVVAALEREKVTATERLGHGVSFRAGMLRWVRRDNVLSPIDRGSVRVELATEGLRIDYELRFVQLLLVATVMIGGIAALVGARQPAELPTFALLAWAWLFGGNFVISIVRFRRFLRRAIESGGP